MYWLQIFEFTRMIHAFISCGLLETQYKSFTKAALMGFVEKTAIKRSTS